MGFGHLPVHQYTRRWSDMDYIMRSIEPLRSTHSPPANPDYRDITHKARRIWPHLTCTLAILSFTGILTFLSSTFLLFASFHLGIAIHLILARSFDTGSFIQLYGDISHKGPMLATIGVDVGRASVVDSSALKSLTSDAMVILVCPMHLKDMLSELRREQDEATSAVLPTQTTMTDPSLTTSFTSISTINTGPPASATSASPTTILPITPTLVISLS